MHRQISDHSTSFPLALDRNIDRQVTATWSLTAFYTAGQNDVKIGRSAATVSTSDGREFTTHFVLSSVRQYYNRNRRLSWCLTPRQLTAGSK